MESKLTSVNRQRRSGKDKHMEKERIREEVLALIGKVMPREIKDYDENLFGREYDMMPMEMVYVCMELKKRYGVDLNKLVDEVQGYSVNELVRAVEME